MPDIRLQDYVAKIKELIREVRLDEAIRHGQHILRHYPKHFETYSVLGEACLEKELYRESIEFFQRTLSADPENLIARVGLGIIYDEQGALPEAIWQLERAFELAPGNAEVRRELQRLYARHGGADKARLKLTRGALGRLYSRNGLYERAIGEFLAVLRQDPDLPDIQVALAEALWRDGRRVESVEICLEILETLPNCLKANLLLGEAWLRSENAEAGEEKLKVARELDPENRVAQDLMGQDSPLPPEEVMIPDLDAVPAGLAAVVPLVKGVPVPAEWELEEEAELAAEELPLELAEPLEAEEELPGWLRDVGVVAEEEPVLDLEAEESILAATEPEETVVTEVPDWLQEVMGEEGLAPVEEPPAVEEVALEEEFAPGEEPEEWLLEEEEAPSPVEAPLVGGIGAGGGIMAGMMVAAGVFGEAEPEPAEDEGPTEEIPEWLQELMGEEPPSAEEEVVAPSPDEEIVAVVEAAEEEGVPTAEVPASLMALVEAGLLDESDLESAMAEMSEEELVAQRSEDVPVWLQELIEEEVTPGVQEEGAAAEAELLEEAPLPVEEDIALPVAEAIVEEEVLPEEEELPDWLLALAETREEEAAPPEAEVAEEEAVLPVVGLRPAAEMPEEEVVPAEEMLEPEVEALEEEVPSLEEAVPAEAAVEPEIEALEEEMLALEEAIPAVGVVAEEEAVRAEEVIAPVAEMPVEEKAAVEEMLLPEVEAGIEPVEEVAPIEEVLQPAVEVAEEGVPAIEEVTPPVVEMPEEEVPVIEEVTLPAVEMAEEVVEEEMLAAEEVALLEAEEMAEEEVPVAEEVAPPEAEEFALPAAEVVEEEVRVAEEAAPPVAEEAVPPGVEAVEEEVPPPAEVAAPSRIEELLAEVKARPRDHQKRLELARAHSAEQDWGAAVVQYEKLVSARKLMPDVLEDLEALAGEDVDRVKVYQLMGDVYMQQDQLDKALEMYRQARQSLARH